MIGEISGKRRFSGQEFIDGKLFYGTIWSGEKILICSDGSLNFCKSGKFTKGSLSPWVWKRFESGDSVNGRNLVDKLFYFFADHIYFSDLRIPLLLAIWVMGTYVYKVFNYYGYLWFTSPLKRCGKSLALDLLAQVCFNATSRQINPSEASIFREIDSNSSTLIIDEVETLRSQDKERFSYLMAIFNGGFQAGSQISRVDKNQFRVMNFEIYSPKVLAGINRVSDTIEDRSFRIFMPRKRRAETVRRFNLRKIKTEIEVLKEELYLWALRNVDEVWEVYSQLDGIKEVEDLDDRAKDVWEPILIIASIIDTQDNDPCLTIFSKLTELAKDMHQARAGREYIDGIIPSLIAIFQKVLSQKLQDNFISSRDLLEIIKGEDGQLNFINSAKSLASVLAKFNLYPRQDKTGKIRGYVITENFVNDFIERYSQSSLYPQKDPSNVSETLDYQDLEGKKQSVKFRVI